MTLNGPVDHLDANVPLDEISIAIGIVASNKLVYSGYFSPNYRWWWCSCPFSLLLMTYNPHKSWCKRAAFLGCIRLWRGIRIGTKHNYEQSRLSIMQGAMSSVYCWVCNRCYLVQIVTFSGSFNAKMAQVVQAGCLLPKALGLINNLTADGATLRQCYWCGNGPMDWRR